MARPHPLHQKLYGTSPFMLLLVLLLLLADAGAATIHDLLRNHGLPGGLLPSTVQSFALDQRTGLLQARLDAPCYALWHDSRVFFDHVVAGNLGYGKLSGVVGLSQEELFLWLPVRAIAVADPSSGVLLLDIGVALKQLSLSLFDDPPDCRPAGELDVPGAFHGPK